MSQNIKHWKNLQSIDDALYLIDIGIIITKQDIPAIQKVIHTSQHKRIIAHFIDRLSERYNDRDSSGILLESLFIWLGDHLTEKNIIYFLEYIFEHAQRLEIIQSFPQMCLSLELVDRQTRGLIFDLSIFLIAQMGLQTDILAKKFPEEFSNHQTTIQKLSAFMISIGNENSLRTRMCLLNYFGWMYTQHHKGQQFNKIMERFGSTLIKQLFQELFEGKSQQYILTYLLENLPYVLLSKPQIQNAMQHILRHNMLKHPIKFSIFIKIFIKELKHLKHYPPEQITLIKTNFLKHLNMLLGVASNLQQHTLAKHIILSIVQFKKHPVLSTIIENIHADPQMNEMYITALDTALQSSRPEKKLNQIKEFQELESKNKPKIKSAQRCGIFDQIFHQDIRKAG